MHNLFELILSLWKQCIFISTFVVMQITLDLASETLNKESWEFRTFNSLLYSLQSSVLEND